MLSLPHDDVYYRLAWTLKLVPHLQLDRLTVFGGWADEVSGGPAQVDYKTVDELIKFGTGWKELYYITPDTSILSFEETEWLGQKFLRKPQPTTWRSALSERDGPGSGASVMVYRSGNIIERPELEHYEQDAFEHVIAPQHLGEFGLSVDSFLDTSSEQSKETLVFARRGRNANITKEISNPPYDQDYDIRALARNRTWSQIR